MLIFGVHRHQAIIISRKLKGLTYMTFFRLSCSSSFRIAYKTRDARIALHCTSSKCFQCTFISAEVRRPWLLIVVSIHMIERVIQNLLWSESSVEGCGIARILSTYYPLQQAIWSMMIISTYHDEGLDFKFLVRVLTFGGLDFCQWNSCLLKIAFVHCLTCLFNRTTMVIYMAKGTEFSRVLRCTE
jgi:hypothetical protein